MPKKEINEIDVEAKVYGNLKSLKRFSDSFCANINILAGKASLSLLFGIEREAEENNNVLVSTELSEDELLELKSHVKGLLRFPKDYKNHDELVEQVTDLILKAAVVVLTLKVK